MMNVGNMVGLGLLKSMLGPAHSQRSLCNHTISLYACIGLVSLAILPIRASRIEPASIMLGCPIRD